MAIRTETIVTRYEVVTVQHEQGVDRIRQKQKQLELQLKDWNEEAKRMEQVHAKAWKTTALAIAGAGAAVVGLKAAFLDFERQSRLSTAAGAVNIDRLSEAAGGLQSRMELLEFAAKAQHGAFKLSTDQMVVAQQAIRAITRSGYEQEEATKKVTEAIVKLEGGPLADFGIRVRSASTDGEKFQAVMDALAGKAKEVEGATETEAEAIRRLGTDFADAGDRIKKSLGELVVSMRPLIEAAAELAGVSASLIGKITEGWGGLFAVFGGRDNFFSYWGYDAADFSGKAKSGDALDNYLAQGGSTAGYIAAQMGRDSGSDPMTGQGGTSVKDDSVAVVEAYLKRQREEEERRKRLWGDKPKGSGSGPSRREIAEARAILRGAYIDYTNFGEGVGQFDLGIGAQAGYAGLGVRADEEVRNEFGRLMGFDTSKFLRERLTQNWRDRLAGPAPLAGDAIRATQKSELEKLFGPLSEFNAYKQAFDTLAGASSSALSAWIDGSKSAGEAFKSFIGDALKGLASQLLIESLKHGAYALGSLAFGDVSGAAKHGAAAAAFGAGAAAAAVAARELGGGGAGAAANVGAGAGGALPSGAGGGTAAQTNSAVIVVGSMFSYESPRNQQRIARRLVDDARGTNSVVYG